MNIIGQQVGLRADEQRVSCGVGSQSTSRQTAHCLVDVEEWDIGVLGTLTQPVGRWPLASSVRVMDKNLRKTQIDKYAEDTMEACFSNGIKHIKVIAILQFLILVYISQFWLFLHFLNILSEKKRHLCIVKVKSTMKFIVIQYNNQGTTKSGYAAKVSKILSEKKGTCHRRKQALCINILEQTCAL